MKILLTGIDGYIGTQLGQALLEKGYDVTGLDTRFYRGELLYDGIVHIPKIIEKDTREITVEDLKGFDVVIHLAELSNDPLTVNDPENTYKINHTGSVELAKKAKTAGVKRFIYSSSCSAYGIAKEDMVSEESEVNPQTAYAKCKVLVEKDVAKLADDTFTPVFLRNATVFGASPRMRFDLVVNNLSGLAYTTKEIKMTSDGSPWRPLVHVLDVCEAFITTLEAPKEKIYNQVFNVGSTNGNYQVKEVAEIIASVFPGCKVSFGKLDGDTRSYKVNFEKIHKTFPEFKCKRTVKHGAEELLHVFKRIGLTKEIFEDKKYTRIKQIEYLRKENFLTEELFWKKIES